MRFLILLAAAVLLLALVGWITFSNSPGRSSINLETNQIKEDARDMTESGAEMLENARKAMDRSAKPSASESRAPRGPSSSSPPGPPRKLPVTSSAS